MLLFNNKLYILTPIIVFEILFLDAVLFSLRSKFVFNIVHNSTYLTHNGISIWHYSDYSLTEY